MTQDERYYIEKCLKYRTNFHTRGKEGPILELSQKLAYNIRVRKRGGGGGGGGEEEKRK